MEIKFTEQFNAILESSVVFMNNYSSTQTVKVNKNYFQVNRKHLHEKNVSSEEKKIPPCNVFTKLTEMKSNQCFVSVYSKMLKMIARTDYIHHGKRIRI